MHSIPMGLVFGTDSLMSAITLQQIEQRIARLEEELQRLKNALPLNQKREQPWWEKMAGSAEGRPLFAEVAREGQNIRQAERGAATPKPAHAGRPRRADRRTEKG
jgi:uncharacterized small protein (DUF1192 family)